MFIQQKISILTCCIIDSIKSAELFKFNLSKQFYSNSKQTNQVTRKTSTIVDHILTDLFVNTNLKIFIFKIDISDHFPICFLQPTSRPREENEVTYITKRVINNNAIELLKQELYKTSWDVINNKNPNDAYNYFSHKLIVLYDIFQNKI